MTLRRYESTVRVRHGRGEFTVSLIVDACLDENYGADVDGHRGTRRMEYVFVSSFIDQPPYRLTDDEARWIITQAQTQFIRERRQWL